MLQVVLIGFFMNLGLLAGPAPGPFAGISLLSNGEESDLRSQAVDTVATRWVVDSGVSEARYRVREQLAGFDFPNDAVGTTRAITGVIVVAADGTIQPDRSEVRVDLATLATDNQRRDGFVKGRTLEVEQYPEAVLVPLRIMGLEGPLPESGSNRFQLEADVTLHGHTRTLTWEVMATFGSDAITGLATTAFTFETFEIPIPEVARVLSVADDIRLELEFRIVPDGS